MAVIPLGGSGGGGGQKITIDGSVLKDLNLTVGYQWVDKSVLPINDISGTNTMYAWCFQPVGDDIYATYDFSSNPSRGLFKRNGYGWDKVGEMIPNIQLLAEYQNTLYAITVSALWKFENGAFTKVADLPQTFTSLNGCVEYKNELHFLTKFNNKYYHYKFNGVNITLVMEITGEILYCVRPFGVYDGKIYALKGYNTSATDYVIRIFSYNGTEWSKEEIIFIDATGERVSLSTVCIDKNGIYITSNNYKPMLYKLNRTTNKFDPHIRLPFVGDNGRILRNKDGLNLISWFEFQTSGSNLRYGNGLKTNHLVYKKVLCLED